MDAKELINQLAESGKTTGEALHILEEAAREIRKARATVLYKQSKAALKETMKAAEEYYSGGNSGGANGSSSSSQSG